jgi:hypothetical protein
MLKKLTIITAAVIINAGTITVQNQGTCGSQTVNIGPYDSSCPSKHSSNECTYTELSKPACDKLPCSGATKLHVKLQSKLPPGSCCRRCTCYGDPHCQSFNGVKDSWILCDARETVPGKPWCKLTAPMCRKQLDHNGNQCVWTPALPGKKWSIPLQGSQCTRNPEGPDPYILMYKADSFSLLATLGERGIISGIKMTLNNKDYEMTGEDCFSNPWGPIGPPAENDATITVDKQGNNIRYLITDLITGIQVRFICMRFVIKGTMGPARINVEDLIEPADPSTRNNVDGFCYTDVIDKGLSYNNDRTAMIQKKGLCQDNVDMYSNNMIVGKQICGANVYDGSSLSTCIESWCLNQGVLSPSRCKSDIASDGWSSVWCAANILPSKNVTACGQDDTCKMCLAEMNDFGFIAASVSYQNYNSAASGCLQIANLPNTLGTCQNGVSLQYQDPNTGNWVTFKSIPQGTALCPSQVLSSDVFPELFTNKIRIASCPNVCASTTCSRIQGYRATITYIKAPDMCPCEPQKEYEGRNLDEIVAEY